MVPETIVKEYVKARRQAIVGTILGVLVGILGWVCTMALLSAKGRVHILTSMTIVSLFSVYGLLAIPAMMKMKKLRSEFPALENIKQVKQESISFDIKQAMINLAVLALACGSLLSYTIPHYTEAKKHKDLVEEFERLQSSYGTIYLSSTLTPEEASIASDFVQDIKQSREANTSQATSSE